MDVVLFHEALAERRRVFAGLPVHVRDLVDRTQSWGRIAMALETPAHQQRLDLLHDLHLVHATVALDAAAEGVGMCTAPAAP